MKLPIFKLLTLFFGLSTLYAHAEGEIRDDSTGVAFPSEISFEHDGKQYQLAATGVATRKKFFVKVYSVASYLQKDQGNAAGDILQEVMQDNKAKQLTIKWVHEASADKIQNGYMESFKKALSGEQIAQLQSDIDTFIRFFNQEVKKGDEHVLRWIPGGYVEVMMNGKKIGSINNPEFAKGLWSIWFGQNSVVNRNHLVSR